MEGDPMKLGFYLALIVNHNKTAGHQVTANKKLVVATAGQRSQTKSNSQPVCPQRDQSARDR